MKNFGFDMGPVVPGSLHTIGPMIGSDRAAAQRRRQRYRDSCRLGGIKQNYLVPFVPDPNAAAEPIVDSGVTLIGLGADDCRWPIGVDCDGAHRFCGCPQHRPRMKYAPEYCEPHTRMALKPVVDNDAEWKAESKAILEAA
jgi:hypothetical protein